jgi:hypothetical protein
MHKRATQIVNCRVLTKERRVNPPLFKDFLRRTKLAVFLLENSPTHYKRPSSKEGKNMFFPSQNNTGDGNEERG